MTSNPAALLHYMQLPEYTAYRSAHVEWWTEWVSPARDAQRERQLWDAVNSASEALNKRRAELGI